MSIKCFWITRANMKRRWLRRYSRDIAELNCPVPRVEGGRGYHNAKVFLSDAPEQIEEHVRMVNGRPVRMKVLPADGEWFKGDPRWPTQCACGYRFGENDMFQLFSESLYRRVDYASVPVPGEQVDPRDCLTLEEAPPGAMWDAWWHDDIWRGPDGLHIVVRLPDGTDWLVDGPAQNCTLKEDAVQLRHHCWTRTGIPPFITVGKDAGPSCGAGSGSIQTLKWHGFLRNGVLTT